MTTQLNPKIKLMHKEIDTQPTKGISEIIIFLKGQRGPFIWTLMALVLALYQLL